MTYFSIDLDDFCEDIFHEMERISDGGKGHCCEIIGATKSIAVDHLIEKLAPFLANQFSDAKDGIP
jgi:hypothetical protein